MTTDAELVTLRMKCLSNPITFRIISEIIENPEITSKDLKVIVNMSGSRIFYFINMLVEADIIYWNKKEKISSTMSRRKFKIHESFQLLLYKFDNPGTMESKKDQYILQLSMVMAVAAHQLEDLADIPEDEFEEYLEHAGIQSIVAHPQSHKNMSKIFVNHREFAKKNMEE